MSVNSRRPATRKQADGYEPPDSIREVAEPHAPRPAVAVSEQSASVVVKEAGTERYQAGWSDQTIVTRRRSPSLSGANPPNRKRWINYAVWGVVGVAAFALGGVLTQLKGGAGTGTVVEVTRVEAAVQPQNPEEEPAVVPPAAEPAAEASEDPVEDAGAPSTATLDQLPPEKPGLPRAKSVKPPAPAKVAAPKAPPVVPTKTGIPEEI